ncbi:MAG TPA: lipocalin family protein [Fibrella sp.]
MNMTLSTRRLSWALLLTITFLFGACSKKNTDVTPNSAAIQGSWRLSAYTIDPAFDLLGKGTKTNDLLEFFKEFGGQEFVDCFKAVTLTFTADGKINGTTTAQCTNVGSSPIGGNATWVLTGSKLKITEGTDVTDYDVSLNGNTLKLSQTVEDDFDGDNKTETGTLSLVMTKV